MSTDVRPLRFRKVRVSRHVDPCWAVLTHVIGFRLSYVVSSGEERSPCFGPSLRKECSVDAFLRCTTVRLVRHWLLPQYFGFSLLVRVAQ